MFFWVFLLIFIHKEKSFYSIDPVQGFVLSLHRHYNAFVNFTSGRIYSGLVSTYKHVRDSLGIKAGSKAS